MFQKDKRCSECYFSKYLNNEAVLACGFICKLNPFKPVVMGLTGKHSHRKQNKKEQYAKKDS